MPRPYDRAQPRTSLFDIVMDDIDDGVTKCLHGGNNKRLCNEECHHCFTKSFASHPNKQFWSYANNGDVKPRNVFRYSHKKYSFECNNCHHLFCNSLSNISNGQWCPFCSSQELCDDTTCNICFEKSFQSSAKALHWYQGKNGNTTPRDVFKSTHTKYWFNCMDCDHSFFASLYHISAGKWCPYCSSKELCDDKPCTKCYEKSFASHPQAQFWDYQRNKNQPRNVLKSSDKKFWFKCNDCGHSFCTSLSHVLAGRWCPYCSPSPKELCDDINCKTCFEKSFASHSRSIHWFYQRNDRKPRDVFKSSNKKYWFKCSDCGKPFCAKLCDISKGNWCPVCKKKTERLVYQTLLSNGYEAIHQARFEWCKSQDTTRYLPFDICIEAYKIIVEIDGPQHFQQISNWSSPDENRKKDVYKMKCAEENGYKVIRIVQEDILNKDFDWYATLLSHLEELDRAHCFISICDTIYDEHIKELESTT